MSVTRYLCAAAAALAVFGAAFSIRAADEIPATAAPVNDNASGGFLFVTFHGESSPMTEQIYFGLSWDGRQWEVLNHEQPVLVSDVGEKGVRDPYIFRSHDGGKFYIVATDLSINLSHGHAWERATHQGSKSIVIWESTDLAHWSAPRLVKVAPDDAGCTWAPEVMYDDKTGDYLVYWASKTGRDQFAKQRIWACRTRDLQTFDAPFVYIEKAGTVFDTDIVRENGRYYRFTKDETTRTILMETGDELTGPWQTVPQFSLAKLEGYEGPACFPLVPAGADKPATWCLLLDRGGYRAFVTHDLSRGDFVPADDIKFPFPFRHGAVLPISAAEVNRLKTAYQP